MTASASPFVETLTLPSDFHAANIRQRMDVWRYGCMDEGHEEEEEPEGKGVF